MEIKLKNVNNRGELAKVIGEHFNEQVIYMRMPTMNFKVGEFTINREGNIDFEDDAIAEELRQFLNESGYELDEETQNEPPQEKSKIVISVEDLNVENLKRIVESKQKLIEKSLGIPLATIEADIDFVTFDWLPDNCDEDTETAVRELINGICKLSKDLKKVTAKSRDVENEKYTFRCFLLRLGLKGDEHKKTRKILLKNLGGCSAFLNGRKEADK